MRKKTTSLALTLLLMASFSVNSAFAMEVPISSTSAEINGQQIITEVYEVSSDIAPETLVKEDFTRNSILYTFDRITKETTESIEKKTAEKEVSVPVKNKSLDSNLDLLQPSIPYQDEEQYTGNLYLDPASVKITTNGYSSRSKTLSETKTYSGLEYNDPNVLPQTIQKSGSTLKISNVKWKEESLIEDGSIPSTYTAVVTYSKKVSSSVPTGYTMTAKYSGEVQKTDKNITAYTIIYSGTELPTEIIPDMEDDQSGSGFFGQMNGGTIALVTVLAVLGGILFILDSFILLKKNEKKGGAAPMTSATDLSMNDSSLGNDNNNTIDDDNDLY